MVKAANAPNFLDPTTFIEGLTDDVDLEITAATFEEYDFNGKAQPRDGKSGNVCAIHLTLEGPDQDKPLEQFWPCGPIENWQPTDDGEYVEAVGGKTGFYKYSAGSLLINALMGIKGFPKGLLADRSISALVGFTLHWNQVPKEGSHAGGDGREKTILLPTALVSAPGKGGAKKAAPAVKSSTRKPAADEDEDEEEEEEEPAPAAKKAGKKAAPAEAEEEEEGQSIDETAEGIAQRVAEELSGPMTLEEFVGEVFEAVTKEKGLDRKTKKQIVELVGDEDWLAEHAAGCGVKWNAKKQTVAAA